MYRLQYSVANVASNEFPITADSVYSMYLRGEISYWDYLLIYVIINDNSVPAAINYANSTDPGGSLTARGRALATQVLTELGREDEVSQLPKGAFSWKVWLPVGLGAVAVLALTARRKS